MNKAEELQMYMEKYPDVSPILIFKISMTKYGCVFSKRALQKLQEPYYRFTKAEPFGISLEIRKEDFYTPGAVCFRDGSSVLVNYGEPYSSPYLIDYDSEDDVFLAKDGDVTVDTVDFIPRPAFFDAKTSKGTSMDLLGGTCTGQRLLLNAFQRCRFWENDEQCHYCALFSADTVLDEVDQDEIVEVVREVLKEPGRFTEISVSGGSDFGGDPPFSTELERYIRLLKKIGTCFDGKAEIQLQAPAYPKDWARRLYEETPLTSYRPNIEIWDKEMFEKRCPGKTRWVGRDEWVRRITDAVEVFGKGRVYTQMVCGAEMAQPGGITSADQAVAEALEGCEFFSRNGVSCHEEMWRPHRAEKLGWQEMQNLDYFIRIAKGFYELHRKYGLTSVPENFMRGSDNPDSDLERGDAAREIPVTSAKELFRADSSLYRPARIPDEVRAFLAKSGTRVFAEIGNGSGRAADITGVVSLDGDRMLVALLSEHSVLSAWLIRSLWYRSPVRIWVSGQEQEAYRIDALVYRNHLVGKEFRKALDLVRSRGGKDMAQAAELHLTGCGRAALPPFEIEEDSTWSRPHLDRQ